MYNKIKIIIRECCNCIIFEFVFCLLFLLENSILLKVIYVCIRIGIVRIMLI